MAELKCHYAMVTTPRKRSRRSLLAASTYGKVAVMTDYQEVDVKEVPLNTPPGKESEVIATVTTSNEDLMRTILDKLEVQSSKLEAHSSKLEAHSAKLEAHSTKLEAHSSKLEAQSAKLEALERLTTPARAVQLWFIADYIYEVCQYGYGHRFNNVMDNIISGGSPQEIVLKHTLESIPTKKMTITKDIARALVMTKPLTGKLSDDYYHCSTLKCVAECLTSDVTARMAKDEDLHACRVLAEAMFGPLQSIIDSNDPEHYKEFTVPRYAKHGKWKK